MKDIPNEKFFRSKKGNFKFPIFFPDATRGFVKSVDLEDVRKTKIPGVLVNTLHLYKDLGISVIKKFGGVREFMGWESAVISDSGGFQIMSLAKKGGRKGKITDEGVTFQPIGGKKINLTPEESIDFQMELNTDLVVVLDDFTPPSAIYTEAKETVERTVLWAKRSKKEFEKICKKKNLNRRNKPYIIGVVQGGDFIDLRKACIERLVEIGFDGLGYGGWPITPQGTFNFEVAKLISDLSPNEYLLYGLGIGKPNEIVSCCRMRYKIFDCVLPTRDARHKRLYVYNASSINEIDIEKPNFYSYYVPDKQKYHKDISAVSKACDCLLCKKYSKAYLAHLARSKDTSFLRLATIHNLRFYSILMEKLQRYF